MNKSFLLDNIIWFETSDDNLKEIITNNFSSSSFDICPLDISIYILKIHLSDLKKCILMNEIIIQLSETDRVIVNRELDKLDDFYKNIIIDNNDYKIFHENIFLNMNISLEGEYGEITRIQMNSVYLSTRKNNSANFSEPGTGKTIMTLMTHFERERQAGHEINLVIICPISALLVWQNEIVKFVKVPNDKIHIFKKDYEKFNFDEKKFEQISKKKYLITNYDSISKLDDDNFEVNFKGSHIVFDEIHRIKNSEGVKYKNSFSIIRNSLTRTILTGTPYSTSPLEIYAIFNIGWNGYIPTLSEELFKKYSDDIRIDEIKKIVIENLKKDIEPYFFKLKKNEDFGIDDAVDNFSKPIYSRDMDIQVMIDEYIFKKITKLSGILKSSPETEKSLLNGIYKLFSLAQLNSVNPNLINQDFKNELSQNIDIDWNDCPEFKDLPKIIESVKLIQEYLQHEKKIIVWFRYKKNITQFNELLKDIGIKSNYINGDTDNISREKILKSFSDPLDDTLSVLISNPDTIGESISLHKSVFSSLFVEQGFSFYQWAQAKDRIHRAGSPKEKTVVHNYIRSKILLIDSKIYNNLLSKKNIDKEIFTTENRIKDDLFFGVYETNDLEDENKRSIEEYDKNYVI